MNLWFKRTFNQERIGTRFGAKDLREIKLRRNTIGLINSTGPPLPAQNKPNLLMNF
jgi:hypothetical protein